MKVLKILQSFSQGTFIAFILSLLYCGHCSIAEPGYLDFDNLPETNFTCAGKVIGGYYADLEASCQMFHVCTIGQGDEPMDIKFLCLNGTVFDQETRVCERVDEVDCSKSERFYYLNLELYGNTIIPAPEGKWFASEVFFK
ncbi:AAEL006933-PA [Aedes aegypti]|uniref:AAEL006933-PA n=1 Tax=Aedes aegypti TaxID=7159 RepID=Q174D1_AEDAE|nr:AAEL006933-PA [Aedes aegypti]